MAWVILSEIADALAVTPQYLVLCLAICLVRALDTLNLTIVVEGQATRRNLHCSVCLALLHCASRLIQAPTSAQPRPPRHFTPITGSLRTDVPVQGLMWPVFLKLLRDCR